MGHFSICFELLYGKDKCTPNMHMHAHIKTGLYDYGPVHGFWCFTFERFNGVFESFQKNWICPELQIMTKFINCQDIIHMKNTSTSSEEFAWISEMKMDQDHVGSMKQTNTDFALLFKHTENITCNLSDIDAVESKLYDTKSLMLEQLFSVHEVEWLRDVYKTLYPNENIHHCSVLHEQFFEIEILGERYTSAKSKGNHSACISAYWSANRDGSLHPTIDTGIQVGEIQYFFKHTLSLMPRGDLPERRQITHVFACVHWFCEQPHYNTLPLPLKVYTTPGKVSGPVTFLPVSRVSSRMAVHETSMEVPPFGNLDHVLVVCPVNRKLHIQEVLK